MIKFANVELILQMELGHSKLNTGYLVEELAAKQPLSIYHLRQYLAPSALPSRLSSPSAKAGSSTFSPPSSSYSRQRSSSSTLAATAAAAESSKSDLFDGWIVCWCSFRDEVTFKTLNDNLDVKIQLNDHFLQSVSRRYYGYSVRK